jgi:Type IV conjugative transfer system lipoprotein (TraV)
MKLSKPLSLILVGALSLITFSGCSSKAMMPYEEEFTCPRANEGGECGSVSKIYANSLKKNSDSEQQLKMMLSQEKKSITEAKTTDEEQSALIGVLWRLTKEQMLKIEKLKSEVGSFEFKNNMALGLSTSLSKKLDSLEEKVSRISLLLSNDNNITSPDPTKVPTANTGDTGVVQAAKKVSTVFIKSKSKSCSIEGKTNEACEAKGKCYATSYVIVRDDANATANAIRTDKRCSKYEVSEIKNGRANIGSGWVAVEFLKKYIDNSENNKTLGGDKNVTKKN